MRRVLCLCSLLLALWLFVIESPPACAVYFGFDSIFTDETNALDAAIGEAQLYVGVTDPLGGEDPAATQALFTFLNTGPDACSITDIYFDNYGWVLGRIAEEGGIDNSGGGVSFSKDASPANLPGGGGLDFPFFAHFSAEADPIGEQNGVTDNGVNPGESLGILFDLAYSQSFGDVLSALQDVSEYPVVPLRIGIHVQGFAGEGSESFVNAMEPTSLPVPEPNTMFLLGLGLIGLAGVGRKKFVKK